MLRLLARSSETLVALAGRVAPDLFQTVRNRELLALLVEAGGDVGGYVARSQDDRAIAALSALTLEPTEGEPSPAYAEDVWARLKEFALKRRSTELRGELQKLNPQTDARYDGLFEQLISIDGELRRLRDRPAPLE
jgi:hypothetical protein